MMHRLFNVLTVVSLVLCLPTIILWVRSEFVGDAIYVGSDPLTLWRFGGDSGSFFIGHYHGVRVPVRRQFCTYTLGVPASDIPHLEFALNLRGAPAGMWARKEFFVYYGVTAVVVQPDGSAVWAIPRRNVYLANYPTARFSGPVQFWETGVPFWVTFLICLAIPSARASGRLVRSTIHRGRRTRGLCPHCGYDLRATPDRCPECGTVPKKILISN